MHDGVYIHEHVNVVGAMVSCTLLVFITILLLQQSTYMLLQQSRCAT